MTEATGEVRSGFDSIKQGGLKLTSLPMRLFAKGNRLFWDPADIDYGKDVDDWNDQPADEQEAEKLQRKWETWGEGVRLVLLDSPYRQFATPLVEYIEEMAAQRQPNEVITIVVPQFVPEKWWHH